MEQFHKENVDLNWLGPRGVLGTPPRPGLSVHLPGGWRRPASYLAGISARFVASTEHSGIDLSRVGLLAPVSAQHSDIQALEVLGEVLCQIETHSEPQRRTRRGGVLGAREPWRRGARAGIKRDLDAYAGDCWWSPSRTPSSWSPRMDSERRC